jgi:hypothetical protein
VIRGGLWADKVMYLVTLGRLRVEVKGGTDEMYVRGLADITMLSVVVRGNRKVL